MSSTACRSAGVPSPGLHDPDPPAKGRCFSPDETAALLSPHPPPPYVGFGYEDEFYQVVPNIEAENKEDLELKEKILNLESFLELEPTAAATIEAVTTRASGSGVECDPVDLWVVVFDVEDE
ncbi:hypothetical protein Ddye_006005 [Dipteronia dyeriana]|uniref:Uncharacterized protein n=1 Tax=Dipteronia dyeriana TaxID=168575 RepID=A0AAE0CQ82_9ROSI|nr:hypothetical protein Ddye_006005 [Dipteronia dyeriana]